MNRRLSLALILALLAQSFAPGLAMALRPEGAPPQTLLICTGDGIKQVVLETDAADALPQPVTHTCPCGMLCGGCGLPPCERAAVRVDYGRTAALVRSDSAVVPRALHAPPRHQVRARPSST
jgi:hypothetical protein